MTTDELNTARALLRQGQIRAGAVAGVALELHLRHVAAVHQVQADTRTSIAQVQDALRFAGIVQASHRKQLKRLTKIRNRCVHARKQLPTRSAVEQLISGIDELR